MTKKEFVTAFGAAITIMIIVFCVGMVVGGAIVWVAS